MESIILVGGGGHCKSIIDTIESSREFNIYGIVDLKENVGKKINNISIIDSDENLYKFKGKNVEKKIKRVTIVTHPQIMFYY